MRCAVARYRAPSASPRRSQRAAALPGSARASGRHAHGQDAVVGEDVGDAGVSPAVHRLRIGVHQVGDGQPVRHQEGARVGVRLRHHGTLAPPRAGQGRGRRRREPHDDERAAGCESGARSVVRLRDGRDDREAEPGAASLPSPRHIRRVNLSKMLSRSSSGMPGPRLRHDDHIGPVAGNPNSHRVPGGVCALALPVGWPAPGGSRPSSPEHRQLTVRTSSGRSSVTGRPGRSARRSAAASAATGDVDRLALQGPGAASPPSRRRGGRAAAGRRPARSCAVPRSPPADRPLRVLLRRPGLRKELA